VALLAGNRPVRSAAFSFGSTAAKLKNQKRKRKLPRKRSPKISIFF